jgi:hypothetical protein
LWQLAQVPGTTLAWLKLADSQAVVRWQLSQLAVVCTWLAVLPRAWLPLWHEAQDPGVTLAWLNAAGSQAVVRWQLSQGAEVIKCWAGLPLACVPLWHDTDAHPHENF